MTNEEIALQITLKYLESKQEGDISLFPNDDQTIGTLLGNIYIDILKTISNA